MCAVVLCGLSVFHPQVEGNNCMTLDPCLLRNSNYDGNLGTEGPRGVFQKCGRFGAGLETSALPVNEMQ